VRGESIKRVVGAGLLAALLLIAGCRMQTSIADINKDPGRFAGKDVSIRGTVSGSAGAMGKYAFQIDDGSGSLWVYSENFGVPGDGTKVSVTGRVEQGFAFGGRSFGVFLRETQARD
jgi:hypothetical protein